MDLATVGGAALGRSLRGVGVNILTRDAGALARFVAGVFDLPLVRASADFALVRHGDDLMQFHSDAAFAGHPLQGLLPENPPRGAGVQVYLFHTDPDAAAARAEAAGGGGGGGARGRALRPRRAARPPGCARPRAAGAAAGR